MATLKIQVGLKRTGFVEYESEMLPEYSMGMVFIVANNGNHYAISLSEVSAVTVEPIKEE